MMHKFMRMCFASAAVLVLIPLPVFAAGCPAGGTVWRAVTPDVAKEGSRRSDCRSEKGRVCKWPSRLSIPPGYLVYFRKNAGYSAG